MGCKPFTTRSADVESEAKRRNEVAAGLSKEVAEDCFGRGNFVFENRGKLLENYIIDQKRLGIGSYGMVSKATSINTNTVRAVKTIPKKSMKNMDKFWREVEIMKLVDHPNSVRLFETFEDNRNVYMVMELCEGGELFDKIIEAGHFTENQAAIVMQQVLRAVHYMHEQKICHRDLKPENFLLAAAGPVENNYLKIIDFGLACSVKNNPTLTTKAGTPYYVAPEVLAGKYDHMCDLWSIGVIMYVILCGYPPFYGETDDDVLQRVRAGSFSFATTDWKYISSEAKDLIRQLLRMNPRERITCADALQHEWIIKKGSMGVEVPDDIKKLMVDNLKKFRSHNKLKKAALTVIAEQLSDKDIENLKNMFLKLDANNDGQLSVKEIQDGIRNLGVEFNIDLKNVIESIDSDGSGVIDYSEFLAATIDHKQYIQEDVVWSAFRIFDLDGDGQITRSELEKVLSSQAGDGVSKAFGKSVDRIMDEVDIDGDGTIDFVEFMKMMRK